jgi:maleylpyruvate isomerase
MSVTAAEIERDLELGRRAHSELLALLSRVELDAAAPSRLPGWTKAAVLTHLARNADGHRRMIEGADRGEVVEQYEGGVEGRIVEIEAGAQRSAADAIDDLRDSTVALEGAWSRTRWRGRGRRTLAGPSPIDRLPFLRTREVSLHAIDLDIGVELADLDPLYVRLELSRLAMLWSARQPMGMTPLPDAVLELTPPDRVGWFTGRLVVDDVPPAGIF